MDYETLKREYEKHGLCITDNLRKLVSQKYYSRGCINELIYKCANLCDWYEIVFNEVESKGFIDDDEAKRLLDTFKYLNDELFPAFLEYVEMQTKLID